jgi:hypothetical protein
MPCCYYTCNLLPLDLVARAGYTPHWLGHRLRDAGAPARREALSIHPMTCPYVTKLVAAADELLGGEGGGSDPSGAATSTDAGATATPDDTPGAEGTAGAGVPHGEGAAPAGGTVPGDCLVVPGGCDAARRMGDLLAATYPDRVFVLPMPRSAGPEVTKTLAADLTRLEDWLRARLPAGTTPKPETGAAPGIAPEDKRAPEAGAAPAPATYAAPQAETEPRVVDAPGAEPTPAASRTAAQHESPTLDYPAPPRPGGVFVVAGPLSDDSLLGLINRLGANVSGLESCTSPDRWKRLAATESAASAPTAEGAPTSGAPTAGGAAPDPGSAAAASAPDYEVLAAQLLEAGMCPRRSTVARRDYLVRRLDESRPASIIYARQSFCDPGAYDALLVAKLAEERDLPYLEIEVDFPFDANGPLRTRVEAFLEAQSLDDDLLGDDLFGDAPGSSALDGGALDDLFGDAPDDAPGALSDTGPSLTEEA